MSPTHVVTAHVSAGAALVVGALVLADWAAGDTPAFFGSPAMAPVTALSTALIAAAVLLSISPGVAKRIARGRAAPPPPPRTTTTTTTPAAVLVPKRLVARAIAIAVGGMCVMRLVEWAVGAAPFDDMVQRLALGARHALGRPSASTAVALGALCAAVLLFDRPGAYRRRPHPAELSALAAVLVAAPALGGYVYGGALRQAVTVAPALRMALPTALSIILIAFAILCARTRRGLMALLTSDLVGGRAARRFAVAALLIPLLGAAVIAAEDLFGLDLEYGAALFASGAFFIAVALAFNTAASLNRVDLERRASEARARLVVDEAADGIFLTDADGNYIDVNRAGAALAGYEREEIIGKKLGDLTTAGQRTQVEDARAALLSGSSHRFEWTMTRKDGSAIEVEASAKRLPDGRVQLMVRDVTARKRAERETARTRAWLQAVLDQAPEGVVLFRGDGTFDANAAAALRFSGGGAGAGERGHKLYDMRRPGDSRLLSIDEMPVVRAYNGARVDAEELEIVDADGRVTPVLASACRVHDEEGNTLGAVAFLNDITALKELERLREEWTSVVAHDLRQPITVLQLSASTLATQKLDDVGARSLDRLRAATAALRRMIGDLLDASRIEAKRMVLDRREHAVTALVDEIVERHRGLLPGHRVRVEASCDVGVAVVDAGRLEQMLGNLLTNADKYGEAGSEILVSVHATDATSPFIEIAVTNRGPEIPEHEIPHLFERFRRAENAPAGVGIGIGLYIVKGLAQAHGGSARCESSGGTTTFRITLPRSTTSSALASVAATM